MTRQRWDPTAVQDDAGLFPPEGDEPERRSYRRALAGHWRAFRLDPDDEPWPSRPAKSAGPRAAGADHVLVNHSPFSLAELDAPPSEGELSVGADHDSASCRVCVRYAQGTVYFLGNTALADLERKWAKRFPAEAPAIEHVHAARRGEDPVEWCIRVGRVETKYLPASGSGARWKDGDEWRASPT